jgi:hypothetical protein
MYPRYTYPPIGVLGLVFNVLFGGHRSFRAGIKRWKVSRDKNNQTLKVFAKHPRNEVEGAKAFRVFREHLVFP